MSPGQHKADSLPPPSPRLSPRDAPRPGQDRPPSRAESDFRSPPRAEDLRSTPRAEDFRSPSRADDFRSPSRAEAEFRSPSRAEADYRENSSRGSSERASSVRDASSPPPSASSRPQSIKSEPGTPLAPSSSMGLISPPIPPPLVSDRDRPLDRGPVSMGLSFPPPHHSMSSPHPLSHSILTGSHSMPTTPTSFPLPSPLTSSFGLLNRGHMTPMGPLSGPMFPHHLPPHGLSLDGPPFRHSILPSRTIDPQENLEQYMEIEKPETEKLQQMVTDLNEKVSKDYIHHLPLKLNTSQ